MKKSDAITYTNRKGKTYYLCEKKTKTGKKRYVFAKQPGLKKLEDNAQYTPVLRFQLVDEEHRWFGVERMCYRGGFDGWLPLGAGKIEKLAKRYVGHLGKESFYELM